MSKTIKSGLWFIIVIALSLSSYLLGAFTIKYEMFPYQLYKSWKRSPYDTKRKSSQELFTSIQNGGYVIQFRHTHRDRLSIAKIPADIDLKYACDDGANLTSLGKEQAKWIKINMDQHKIPKGEVFSSPACRLKEMNEIMFPDHDITYSKLLLYDRILSPDIVSKRQAYIRYLLSKPTNKGSNRYIMGHQGTFHPPGENLLEGHAFIYKPLGDSNFDFLGSIDLVTWLP